MKPEEPSNAPATMSGLLSSAEPIALAERPAYELSRAITVGMSAPSMGTEILTAREAGADGVKVSPAMRWAERSTTKSIKALPHIDLIPIGGINLETIGDFLAAGSIAVGVGSELIVAQSVASGNYTVVTAGSKISRNCGEA
jgi:2-keto-3-deoxy-6-phosphogluconate aldolase